MRALAAGSRSLARANRGHAYTPAQWDTPTHVRQIYVYFLETRYVGSAAFCCATVYSPAFIIGNIIIGNPVIVLVESLLWVLWWVAQTRAGGSLYYFHSLP